MSGNNHEKDLISQIETLKDTKESRWIMNLFLITFSRKIEFLISLEKKIYESFPLFTMDAIRGAKQTFAIISENYAFMHVQTHVEFKSIDRYAHDVISLFQKLIDRNLTSEPRSQ